MVYKQDTAILLFIFSLHFLTAVNIYGMDRLAEPTRVPATLQRQNPGLHTYDYNDIPLEGTGWEEMFFRAVRINDSTVYFIVSSELEPVDPFEGLGRYGGHMLFDDDTTTAWVEGVGGQGKGEFILFSAGDAYPESLIIHSGYQKSERLYKMNSRPHTLKISLYAGFYLEGDDSEISSRFRLRPLTGIKVLELADIMGARTYNTPFDKDSVYAAKDTLAELFFEDYRQEIENHRTMCPTCDPEPRFSFFIKLEIKDTYEGSEWADNCISEISYMSSSRKANMLQSDHNIDSVSFSGEAEGGTGYRYGKTLLNAPIEGAIIDVYEDEDTDAGLIYVDTENSRGIILADKTELEESKLAEGDGSLNIVLMDVSPDKEWALVDILFYPGGSARVEEHSALYNVRLLQRVDESILETQYGIFGFVEDDGRTWLDTIDGFIDLDKIKNMMLKARDKGPGIQ